MYTDIPEESQYIHECCPITLNFARGLRSNAAYRGARQISGRYENCLELILAYWFITHIFVHRTQHAGVQ